MCFSTFSNQLQILEANTFNNENRVGCRPYQILSFLQMNNSATKHDIIKSTKGADASVQMYGYAVSMQATDEDKYEEQTEFWVKKQPKRQKK